MLYLITNSRKSPEKMAVEMPGTLIVADDNPRLLVDSTWSPICILKKK